MVTLNDTGTVKSRTRTTGTAGRRGRRTGAGSLLAITAVLGLSLATAGPATATETGPAADAGTWRAYGNTNPITSSSATWACAGSKTVATSVIAQVCAIRSATGGSVQAAVIVRNNRSMLYSTSAYVELYTATSGSFLGSWECASSGVGANSWSVCFGKTLSKPSSVKVDSPGWIKGTYLGWSPSI
ncbi:hypothetical protein [Streptomyces aureocirculatus]|uniref:hypothetical protein n=1 Tax=Streptomyces aureocirculatus TaxID=67275 RepID=UPI0018FEA2C1|nr:hypothetical protein [Streptomyces aureocirculatus]